MIKISIKQTVWIRAKPLRLKLVLHPEVPYALTNYHHLIGPLTIEVLAVRPLVPRILP